MSVLPHRPVRRVTTTTVEWMSGGPDLGMAAAFITDMTMTSLIVVFKAGERRDFTAAGDFMEEELAAAVATDK